MNLAVDGDGASLFESHGDPRKARVERADEVPDLPSFDVVFDHATTEGACDRRRHDDARRGAPRRGRSSRTGHALRGTAHSAASRGAAASSAADSRGGDIGNSVMRTPVARAMALPIAAIGGTIGTSPTPRTP